MMILPSENIFLKRLLCRHTKRWNGFVRSRRHRVVFWGKIFLKVEVLATCSFGGRRGSLAVLIFQPPQPVCLVFAVVPGQQPLRLAWGAFRRGVVAPGIFPVFAVPVPG